MSTLPGVSVVVPTLNEEKYLPVLFESLREINHEMEVIIVDGHSDDSTVKVAESFKAKLSPKTLHIINSEVRRISVQRNLGAKQAKNELLLFLDADIKAPSDAEFKYIMTEFISGEYSVATSRIAALDGGRTEARLLTIAYIAQRIFSWFGHALASGNFILVKKSIFQQVNGFDEELRISEDVDFSLKAAKQGKFKLFSVPIKTSTRRAQKYGYRWLKENPLIVFKLLFRGKLTDKDEVFYPFGEY